MRTTISGQTPVPAASLGAVVRTLSFEVTPAVPRKAAAKPQPKVEPKIEPKIEPIFTEQLQQPSSTAIRVVLRIRPLNDRERLQSQQSCVLESKDESENVLNIKPLDLKRHPVAIRNAGKATFKFAKIFKEHSTQSMLFEDTALPLVSQLFEGHSAVVFAYGVTSSGKTWTIQGTNEEPGILPRSLDVIVNSIAMAKGQGLLQDVHVSDDVENLTSGLPSATARKRRLRKKPRDAQKKNHDCNYIPVDASVDYSIFASYLEVYNEQVYDLFESQPSAIKEESCESFFESMPYDESQAAPERTTARRRILKLKENAAGEVYAEGQTECEIRSGADIDRLLEFGQKNRTVAHTEANQRSSRSHAIFIITLKQSRTKQLPGKPPMTKRSSSKFYIVDLAGSERTSRTNNTGQRLKEAAQINTSLMNLGRCLQVLRQNQRIRKKNPEKTLQVVPFRHSRLTRLLQCSLNSGSAVMIANVSPFVKDADETIHALRCAAIAREVNTTAKRRPLADCTNIITNRVAARNSRSKNLVPAPTLRKSERNSHKARKRNQENISTSAIDSVGLKKALESARKGRTTLRQQLETAVEQFRKEKAELEKEIRLLRSEKEEAVLDVEAELEEERKESDALFRENERLKDRLVDAEARFRYMEAEIREEVTQEAEQIIKEVQERCERQVRSALQNEDDMREEVRIMSEEERRERAARAARRITRASSVALDGIALNFAEMNEEEEELLYEEEEDCDNAEAEFALDEADILFDKDADSPAT